MIYNHTCTSIAIEKHIPLTVTWYGFNNPILVFVVSQNLIGLTAVFQRSQDDLCRFVKNLYIIYPSEEVTFKGVKRCGNTSIVFVFTAIHERPIFHTLIVIPGFITPSALIRIEIGNTHSMAELMTDNTYSGYLFFVIEFSLSNLRRKCKLVTHASSVNFLTVNCTERACVVFYLRPYCTGVSPCCTIAGI